ncbi:AEC family transporter [Streptomyces californicus]
MQGVLTGFTVIATVIAVGYVIGRRGCAARQDGRTVLTRLAFNVATPALLFTMLAGADLSVVLSGRLLVTAVAMAATAGIFAVVARFLLRWRADRITIGALCSSYVNAGNLGIPIAVYVLGDASLVAPVLLLQQIVVTPLALTVLDLQPPGGAGVGRPAADHAPAQPDGDRLPGRGRGGGGRTAPAGAAARTARPHRQHVGPRRPPRLRDIPVRRRAAGARGGPGALHLSVALKSLVQPAVAWAVGAGLFGLRGEALLDVA